MRTHAALPVPVPLGGERFRVYCAGRDPEGRAQIGYADVKLGERPHVEHISADPVLSFGALGSFDDRGVLPASIVTVPGKLILYFTGVMLGQTVPFYYAVGAAQSVDGGATWERISQAPVLDRSASDPFLTASPFVLHDGGEYRMWYTSGVRWLIENGTPKHEYLIKDAVSADGLAWRRDGHIAIPFSPGDYAISRPWVMRDDAGYHMWFAHRGAAYRIGYAHSTDGRTWMRNDGEAGIEPSGEDWDSEMICYPSVVDCGGRRYMLYNGNRFGASGFGAAVLEP